MPKRLKGLLDSTRKKPGLRVFFPALKSALIDQPKTPNRQDVGKDVGIDVGLADKIIELISGDRLDNDIYPAMELGMMTVWVRYRRRTHRICYLGSAKPPGVCRDRA